MAETTADRAAGRAPSGLHWRSIVLRELTVVRTVAVTPRMMRVTLGGEQLGSFDRDGRNRARQVGLVGDGRHGAVSSGPPNPVRRASRRVEG